MNLKISWCWGLALPVLLVSAALTACSDKTTTSSTGQTAIALLRYNADGTPDITNLVGGTGLVTSDVNPSQDDLAFAVVRQPADGKIIAVGTSFTTPASVVVIRYNTDGTRDSTFGSNAITVSGTNILVAGHSKIGLRFVIALAQYDSSGVLDTSGFEHAARVVLRE